MTDYTIISGDRLNLAVRDRSKGNSGSTMYVTVEVIGGNTGALMAMTRGMADLNVEIAHHEGFVPGRRHRRRA